MKPDHRVPLLLLVVMLGFVAAGLWSLGNSGSRRRIVAPFPAVTSDLPNSFQLDPSTLTVPIRIDLEALVAEVEEEVPTRWGDPNEWLERSDPEAPELAIAISRSPFRASLSGTTASLSSTVSYQVRRRVNLPLLPDPVVSCGTDEVEPQPRLAVSLEGPISLTRDWRLSTRTSVADLRPASDEPRDRCEVSVIGIDITERVIERAHSFLEDHTAAIDSIVGETDVRSSFEEWWTLLKEPIELDRDVWLEFRPLDISQGQIRGDGDVVEVMATLIARPRIVLGPRPPLWQRPLPLLDSGGAREGLDILLEGSADYQTAGDRLTAALGGESVLRAGRRLTIQSMAVTGIGGGQVALRVQVEGDVVGQLFFVGTPRYDPRTGYVSIPDLEFSIATSDLLVAGLSWVAEAGLEALLREQARWPVEVAEEWAEGWLRNGLNRELTDGVRLVGQVQEARIVGVTARTDRLLVWATASASASLLIDEQGS